MPEILKNIFHTGLIQRCFFFFKKITYHQHKEISQFIFDKKFTNKSYKSENKKLVSSICADLKGMKAYYQEHKLKFADDVYDYAKLRFEELDNELHAKQHIADISFLESSLRRAYDKVSTIAKLNTISRLSDTVTIEDFDVALDLYQKCIYSAIEMLDNFSSDELLHIIIQNSIKIHGIKWNKTQIVEEIYIQIQKTKAKIGKNKIWTTFEEYEKKGYIIKNDAGYSWKTN
jgi:hypothetical protein